MKYRSFYYIFETRFSNREYYNSRSAWRLTRDEYLAETNKGQKFHSSDSYEPTEREILDHDPNPPVNITVKPNKYENGWVDVYWELADGTLEGKVRVSPLEVSNEKDKFRFAQRHSNSDKKYKTINDKYWYSFSEGGYTIKDFPYKLHSINGIDYRIKKETLKYFKQDENGNHLRDENHNLIPYSDEEMTQHKLRKYDITVAAFDGPNIIGQVSDEWGAMLVTVQPNYREKGIGKNLAHTYRTIYPEKDSGGYTPQGFQMAKSVHKKAVKDAQQLGWYKRAIDEGILTKPQVEKILSSIENN